MGRSEDMLSENQYRSGYYDGFLDAWSEINHLLKEPTANDDIESVVELYISSRLWQWLHSDYSVHVVNTAGRMSHSLPRNGSRLLCSQGPLELRRAIISGSWYRISGWLTLRLAFTHVMPPIFDVQELEAELERKKSK